MVVLFIGSRLGEEEVGVKRSHLLFVDDNIIFCAASKEQVTFLCWLLMWFEAMLRLKINLKKKNEMFPMGEVDNVDDLACEIGCKIGILSSYYLGLPLGGSYKSVAIWNRLKKRFRKRLSLWKRQCLSQGENSLYFVVLLLIYRSICLYSPSQEFLG